jgi:hypothetical protein
MECEEEMRKGYGGVRGSERGKGNEIESERGEGICIRSEISKRDWD